AAQAYTKYFERGLRQRIDLYNIAYSNINVPIIEDYTIKFTYAIPVNDQEIIDKADKLLKLVSHETALSQLSFIDNPKAEVEKKELENKNKSINTINKESEEDEIEVILS
ncbi:MAG: phage portal protein, partial [Candidatus Heimdallarchaeaceae archaeon]